LALHLPRHWRLRSDCRRVCLADPRHGGGAQLLRAGLRFDWDEAHRVITDQTASYRPAVAAAVPGVRYRTGRYRTNGIERDDGFLKERLRPMRGLTSAASAAICTSGHALMRNIRRRFSHVVEFVPQQLVLAWTWNRLAEAV
jgi:transposase-like protein